MKISWIRRYSRYSDFYILNNENVTIELFWRNLLFLGHVFLQQIGDKIDIFAKEMYQNAPKDDALKEILSDKLGTEAFLKFLRTEYAEENLAFYNVC